MRISDWSSDVCSSDLEEGFAALRRSVQDRWLDDLVVTVTTLSTVVQHADRIADRLAQPAPVSWSEPLDDVTRQLTRLVFGGLVVIIEIGRRSCRERVCPSVEITVVAASLKKQK